MTNSFTLTNSAINSGTAVYIAAQSVSYNWSNLIGDFPIPGKNDIIATQHQGWKSPGFNIQFYIYLDNNPSGFMTLALWNEFVRNTTTNTTLNVKIGDTDSAFKSYAHSVSGVSDIPINIVSWSTQITPDTNVLLIDCQCIETI